MRGIFLKGIILVFFVGFFFVPNMQGYFSNNKSNCAFNESCEDDDGTSSGNSTSSGAASSPASTGITLGQLISEGGGYFLQSLSDIHNFLGLMESSEVTGVDIQALKESLNAAISNIEKSRETYCYLKDLAAITPYNPVVVNWLIDFDYKGFQEKTGLLPTIFDQVWTYLSSGDVRGIYQRFYDNMGDIRERLYVIKVSLDGGRLPELSYTWRLNQKCTEYKMFGQYVAEVFYNILR